MAQQTPSTTSTSHQSIETNSGQVTSWLPLTTAYPSIPGCGNAFYSVVANTLAGWDPGYGQNIDAAVSCQPDQVTSWWLSQNGTTITSLGPLVCPSAYTTAYSSTKDSSSTFIACCPSGYVFAHISDPGNTGECSSILNPGQVVQYGVRTTDDPSYWSKTSQTISQSTAVAGIQVNGWIFGSSTSSSSTTTTSMPTTATPTPSPGLSVAAEAGIGAGIGLAALLIIALIAGLLMRRRRWKKIEQQPILLSEKERQPFGQPFGQPLGQPLKTMPVRTMTMRGELDSRTAVQEVDAGPTYHEIGSS